MEVGHEELIDRSRLENDHRRDEPGREQHEQQPPEAGDRLGRVFGLEVGIGRAETHPQRHHPRRHQKDRDDRQRHHERRDLQEDIGTHDQDLREDQQRKTIDRKFNPEEGLERDRCRPDDPEGVNEHA